jgi:hypothetical protein
VCAADIHVYRGARQAALRIKSADGLVDQRFERLVATREGRLRGQHAQKAHQPRGAGGLRSQQIDGDAIAQRRRASAEQLETALDRPQTVRQLSQALCGGIGEGRPCFFTAAAHVGGILNRTCARLVAGVHDARHVAQPGTRGGGQPARAGDHIEPPGAAADQQWLQHAVRRDRADERFERGGVHRTQAVDVANRHRANLRHRRTCDELVHVMCLRTHAVPGREALTLGAQPLLERSGHQLEVGVGVGIGAGGRDEPRRQRGPGLELGHVDPRVIAPPEMWRDVRVVIPRSRHARL